MRSARLLACVLAFASLASCATIPPAPAARPAAEEPFVIAANPLAAQAGIEVLKRGGSAVDAAIAVQAMLSLVEPQSSGLGGGAFLNHYDARTGKLTIYDGREVAPAQSIESMFIDSAGKPLPFRTAVLTGRATGVPGVVKLLALAHQDHGKLRWDSLFGAAQRTAAEGFVVSPRLARMIHSDLPQNEAPDVRAYFTKGDGSLLNAGDRLHNPAY